MIERVDDMLVSAAAGFSGWTEARFDLDQWGVARQMLLASFAMFVVNFLPDAVSGRLEPASGMLGFAVVCAMGCLIRMSWQQVERQSRSRIGAQTALIAEARARYVNIVAMALFGWSIWNIHGLVFLGAYLLFAGHLFFKACAPRQPSTKRALPTRQVLARI